MGKRVCVTNRVTDDEYFGTILQVGFCGDGFIIAVLTDEGFIISFTESKFRVEVL
jgi:hypothetical protein